MSRKGFIAMSVGAIIGAVIGYGVRPSALGSVLGAVGGVGIVAVLFGNGSQAHPQNK